MQGCGIKALSHYQEISGRERMSWREEGSCAALPQPPEPLWHSCTSTLWRGWGFQECLWHGCPFWAVCHLPGRQCYCCHLLMSISTASSTLQCSRKHGLTGLRQHFSDHPGGEPCSSQLPALTLTQGAAAVRPLTPPNCCLPRGLMAQPWNSEPRHSIACAVRCSALQGGVLAGRHGSQAP